VQKRGSIKKKEGLKRERLGQEGKKKMKTGDHLKICSTYNIIERKRRPKKNADIGEKKYSNQKTKSQLDWTKKWLSGASNNYKTL